MGSSSCGWDLLSVRSQVWMNWISRSQAHAIILTFFLQFLLENLPLAADRAWANTIATQRVFPHHLPSVRKEPKNPVPQSWKGDSTKTHHLATVTLLHNPAMSLKADATFSFALFSNSHHFFSPFRRICASSGSHNRGAQNLRWSWFLVHNIKINLVATKGRCSSMSWEICPSFTSTNKFHISAGSQTQISRWCVTPLLLNRNHVKPSVI